MSNFQPSIAFTPYYEDIIKRFDQAESDAGAYGHDRFRFPLCFYAPDEFEADVIAFVLWFSDEHPRHEAAYWNEDGLLIIRLEPAERRCIATTRWLRRLRRGLEHATCQAGKAPVH